MSFRGRYVFKGCYTSVGVCDIISLGLSNVTLFCVRLRSLDEEVDQIRIRIWILEMFERLMFVLHPERSKHNIAAWCVYEQTGF